MRRILPALLLLTALASAETIEIRNRQDCYELPSGAVAECLGAIRSGRNFQANVDSVRPAPAARVQEAPEAAPRPLHKKSLEERSVEAQESLASAQHSIASAMWTQIILSSAAVLIGLIVIVAN